MWLPLTTRPLTNVLIVVIILKKMDLLPGPNLRSEDAICAPRSWFRSVSFSVEVYVKPPILNLCPLNVVLLQFCFVNVKKKRSTVALLSVLHRGQPIFPAGALVATTEIIVGIATGIPWCHCQKAKLVFKCQKNWCSTGALHLGAKMWTWALFSGSSVGLLNCYVSHFEQFLNLAWGFLLVLVYLELS